MFVIADRSARFWRQRLHAEHADRQVLTELQPCSREACLAHLRAEGLPEALRTGIATQSQGLPYWLDVALAQFRRLSKVSPAVTPADLSWDGKDIMAIVRIGLTAQEAQTVKQVASVFWFDEALFAELVSGTLQTGYPAQGLQEFAQLSLIEDCGAGRYAVCDTFRKPLRAWLAAQEPALLKRLAAVSSRHHQGTGVIGAMEGVLQAIDLLFKAAGDVNEGRTDAKGFEKALDDVFPGGVNPAQVLRERMDEQAQSLQNVQRELDALAQMRRAAGDDADEARP